jgi:hypothetical protein
VSARAKAAALQCTGEPVSWLALERLSLGELPPDQRRAVEQHLAGCAACAACLAEINRPLALPSLPATTGGLRWFLSHLRAAWRGVNRTFMWGTAGAALLLVGFLYQRARPHFETADGRALAGVKGDGIVLSLVRERDGAIDNDATRFASGDRWKALVTCPSARVVFWDVVVIAEGKPSFPLAPAAPITCGNRVPLPGAFRLEGERPLVVCLFLAGDPVDRARANTLTEAAAACVALQPER